MRVGALILPTALAVCASAASPVVTARPDGSYWIAMVRMPAELTPAHEEFEEVLASALLAVVEALTSHEDVLFVAQLCAKAVRRHQDGLKIDPAEALERSVKSLVPSSRVPGQDRTCSIDAWDADGYTLRVFINNWHDRHESPESTACRTP